eukprot:TRINITY_DN7521_c0_g1_i1.p1 TRINITY_DN7521_c0_g1~~TRINITY_DN7521_c0_g1_i1.p1  ORF type:complete len:208 (-),score=15.43 TRINITY_DN7521_c0_g1_i1:123-746(-)
MTEQGETEEHWYRPRSTSSWFYSLERLWKGNIFLTFTFCALFFFIGYFLFSFSTLVWCFFVFVLLDNLRRLYFVLHRPNRIRVTFEWNRLEQFGINTTNLRLMLMNREFNENDYEMLLGLDQRREQNQNAAATAQQISQLPSMIVKQEDLDETSVETKKNCCPICLEHFTVGESIRTLPCFHKFHVQCIDHWLSVQARCAVCRTQIT